MQWVGGVGVIVLLLSVFYPSGDAYRLYFSEVREKTIQPDLAANRWTRERVTLLRSYNKIPRYCPERQRTEGWMNLTQAAAMLGVSQKTLRLAVERGQIEAEHPLADGPWLFNRSALQSPAADRIVEQARRHRKTPAGPSDAQQDLLLSSTWRDGAV